MKKQQVRGGGQQGRGGGGEEEGESRRTAARSRRTRPPPRNAPSSTTRTSADHDDREDRARRAARPVNAWLRARVRLTPWRSYDEFDSVGRSLLLLLHQQTPTDAASAQPSPGATTPSDGESATSCQTEAMHEQSSLQVLQQRVEEALERVEVWRVKCGGGPGASLPHSVESTHALAACLYEDRYPSSPTCNDAILSLMYASAVTRTVNGLTDVLQQNRAVAASVAHLGRLLGIPGWIVDIRHQATHNAMPSLPILRTAARTLLLYLDQVYWTPLRMRRMEAVELAQKLVRAHRPGDSWDGRKSASAAATLQSPNVRRRKYDSEDDRTMADYLVDDDDEYGMGSNDGDDAGVSSDCGDDMDEADEPTSSVTLPHKVLGTTFNRFAALLEEPKDKKNKNKKTKDASAEAKIDGPGAEATPNQPPLVPEPPTWNSVPVDVTYRAIADHVLQYCRHSTSRPSPDVSVSPPELSIFVEMSRRYPGLVSFVARELEMMDDAPTKDEMDPNPAGVPFLSGRDWAEYVRRLARAHGIVLQGNKRPRHDATATATATTTEASVDIRDKASSILRRHGAGASLLTNGAPPSLATSQSLPAGSSANMNHVSLEAMEALLKQTNSLNGEDVVRSTAMPFKEMQGIDTDVDTAAEAVHCVESPPAGTGGGGWSLCETWEPCAIGTSFIRRADPTSH